MSRQQEPCLNADVKDMILYLTSECQLTCRHCYLTGMQPPKQLSIDDLTWIADTFKIKNTMLIGGEPTLYPQLEEAINLFDRVTLSTNGLTLANETSTAQNLMNMFKTKEKISIQLSIEGNKKDTDDIRGDGVWDKVISAAKLLVKNDIKCYFRCSYHMGNLKSIPWIIGEVGHPLDIPLVLFPLIGAPPLTADQQAWLFNIIVEKNTEYNGRNLIAQPHFMQWLGEKGRCEAGSERLCITYDKDITPCHFDFDYILGHVGMKLDILNKNREMFLKAAKRIQPSCDFCDKAEMCRSSCYMANSHAGCPLKQQFTLEAYANLHDVDVGSLSKQISGMKGLLKESLVC